MIRGSHAGFDIETDIPAPIKTNKWKVLAAAMEEGDSVLIPTIGQVAGLVHALSNRGYKYARKAEGTGFRVWRLKK